MDYHVQLVTMVSGQNDTTLDPASQKSLDSEDASSALPTAVRPKVNFDVPNFLMPNLGRRSRFISFDSNSGDLEVNLELSVPFLTLPFENKSGQNGMLMPLLNINVKALIVFGALMAISAFIVPLFANKSQMPTEPEAAPFHNYNDHQHNYWNKEHIILEAFKLFFETLFEIGIRDLGLVSHFFGQMLQPPEHEHHYGFGTNRGVNVNIWDWHESLNEILFRDNSIAPCLQRVVCSAIALSRHHNKTTSIQKIVEFIKSNKLLDKAMNSSLIDDAVTKGHSSHGIKECFSFYKGCIINRRILTHVLRLMGY